MNYIWSGIIIFSFALAIFGSNVLDVLTAGLDGAAQSAEVLFSFAGIMCFWSGILKVAEESGAAGACEKLLSPVIRRLFPKVDDRRNITLNIIANILGMGNAATPAGVKAMTELDKLNGEKPHPSHEMCRFAVMNTASLQVLPTTVIGILTACGSREPFSVVPCIWISSIVSLSVALCAETFLSKRRERSWHT